MQQRVNIITLGVQDIARSKTFYEKLGWKASSVSSEHMAIFQANGILISLYPEQLLAEDAMVATSHRGFRGVTLAHNVGDKNLVRQVLEQARQAGGTIVKEAQDVFWGGYSGYFADPDGHLWEVAWNPHWPLREDGTLQLP